MRISVAMTTYNGACFLREQLDSILAQSRLPDELVVCDDRSSDETGEILAEYSSRSPFTMKVVVNDERLGSTKNFEKAIGLCSGDLIALCDQDDLWRPEKLAVIEAAFEADPGLGAVLTNADLIDKDGASLSGDLWAKCRFNEVRQDILEGPGRFDLLFGLPFATGATMAFRSHFRPLLLPFPSGSPTFIHDRWTAILIAAVGRIGIIRDKLIAYRLHSGQQLGVGKLPLPLKVFVPHQCRSDAVGLAALEETLRSNPTWTASSKFFPSLALRQRHIAARAEYSRNPFRRLTQVISEYRSGRYVRYPFGLIFCLKDLLVGTR
jgi:hypothetical protein